VIFLIKKKKGHYMVAASECLSHTLDVLSILSLSTNFTVRKEARDMLREVMSRMDDMKLMRNHKVDPLKSPLLAGKKEPDFNNLNPSIYFNYPQPWYAAMYDICHYFEKMHISSDEETTLFSSLPLTFNN
jgi:hypothetical protein